MNKVEHRDKFSNKLAYHVYISSAMTYVSNNAKGKFKSLFQNLFITIMYEVRNWSFKFWDIVSLKFNFINNICEKIHSSRVSDVHSYKYIIHKQQKII